MHYLKDFQMLPKKTACPCFNRIHIFFPLGMFTYTHTHTHTNTHTDTKRHQPKQFTLKFPFGHSVAGHQLNAVRSVFHTLHI